MSFENAGHLRRGNRALSLPNHSFDRAYPQNVGESNGHRQFPTPRPNDKSADVSSMAGNGACEDDSFILKLDPDLVGNADQRPYRFFVVHDLPCECNEMRAGSPRRSRAELDASGVQPFADFGKASSATLHNQLDVACCAAEFSGILCPVSCAQGARPGASRARVSGAEFLAMSQKPDLRLRGHLS
jgi:hypothetical protein